MNHIWLEIISSSKIWEVGGKRLILYPELDAGIIIVSLLGELEVIVQKP